MQAQREAATNSRFLTADAASRYTGLSKSTLDKVRCRGDGPAYHKLSTRVLYARDDLDAWLAERRRTSEAA